MKRLLGIILALSIALVLVGCGGEDATITPPTFQSVLIDGENPVSDGILQTFYKQKEENILVQINISNPGNAEITSVKINGINYRTNRFTENSTSTMIEFTMLAPSEHGQQIFEVDEVIYRDGAIMKGVDATSNNQFEVFVYKDLPIVSRVDMDPQKDSLFIIFSLTDPDETILGGTATVKLYTSDAVVAEQELSPGTQSILFENLFTDQQYEVRVYASYNLEDGRGLLEDEVLYDDIYTTSSNRQPTASIERIQLFENRIVFDIDVLDNDETLLENGLTVGLFEDNQLITSMTFDGPADDVMFDSLFSNSTYTIRVLGDYDLRNGEGVSQDTLLDQHVFTTQIQYLPVPEVVNLEITNERINFNVDLNDPNGVFDVLSMKATLYDNEGNYIRDAVIDHTRGIFPEVQIHDLLSDFTFTLVLTANYNLNDGQGVIEDSIIFETEFATTGNQIPTITVGETLVRQGYIDVEYNIDDPDETIPGNIYIVLYEENGSGYEVVEEMELSVEDSMITIAYPVTYTNNYRLKIFTDYNLYDGRGIQKDFQLYEKLLIPVNPKAPVAELPSDPVMGTESMTFNFTILDADETILYETLRAVLYNLDDEVVATAELVAGENVVVFEELLSDKAYKIEVITDYDLYELAGPREEQTRYESEVFTMAKQAPDVVDDNNINPTTNSIVFDLRVIDPDGVVDPATIEVAIYRNDEEIDRVTVTSLIVNSLTFSDLDPATDYVIKVFANQDYNTGGDILENEYVGEFEATTEE